jgi:uncharacterized protein (DUF1501 family)
MARCCPGYTRSQLIRRAAAEAGSGLPAIEPGMPLPAGTGLSRRSFLLRATGLALSVYGATRLDLGALEEGVAHAATSDRILVSVFLDGGIDSLSLLAPVGDPRYASLRPTLAVAPDTGTEFTEDPRLRWHPAAQALATLHGEGKLTVFPAIGYASPNQSHFTSRHFWEVGALDVNGRLGWLGRYLDREGSADNPLQGLSLSGSLMPALAAGSVPVAAVERADRYDFYAHGAWKPIDEQMLKAIGDLGQPAAKSPALSRARAAAHHTGRLREQLAPFSSYTSPVTYPNSSFGKRLASLAAMIAAGLPLRCVSIRGAGSFDTHSSQVSAFESGLEQSAASLLAFQRDLEARGLADRVLVQIWSEFGRRPQENGSLGTDHGAGGVAFLMGSRASGRMVGEFPGLATLDGDDNLRSTSDFRELYCALLEQWLGADAGPIIPGADAFARPTLLES